jgi:oligopeptide/dipeptide ABC transporter ATP-binding protein
MRHSAETFSEPIAVVDGLTVTYLPRNQPPIAALDGVSLALHSGEMVGVLGESGSGKSTLAGAILRILPAHACYNSGSILFRGSNLLALPETELCSLRGAEIALIFQDPALALNPVLPAGKQISEVLRAHLSLTTGQRKQRVHELLSEVGLEPHSTYSAYPHQLSGGQRQRVAIAMAMACSPALVIADEPTSKLDASLQSEILCLMREMTQRHRTCFLLISHDPTVHAGFVDRIAVMYGGRIVEQGSTEEIFRNPLHPYSKALVRLSARYLGSDGVRMPFSAMEGSSSDMAGVNLGCRFAPRCPEKMEICTERDPEEITATCSHRVSCFNYGY